MMLLFARVFRPANLAKSGAQERTRVSSHWKVDERKYESTFESTFEDRATRYSTRTRTRTRVVRVCKHFKVCFRDAPLSNLRFIGDRSQFLFQIAPSTKFSSFNQFSPFKHTYSTSTVRESRLVPQYNFIPTSVMYVTT